MHAHARRQGLLQAKEAEVARIMASELERTERLKRFNDVARNLMREELRVM